VTFEFRGVQVAFTLDAKGKGRGKPSQGMFGLKIKGKRNKTTRRVEFLGGSLPFSAILKSGSWADEWAAIGTDPAASKKNAPLQIVLNLRVDGTPYTANVQVKYSAKAGCGEKVQEVEWGTSPEGSPRVPPYLCS